MFGLREVLCHCALLARIYDCDEFTRDFYQTGLGLDTLAQCWVWWCGAEIGVSQRFIVCRRPEVELMHQWVIRWMGWRLAGMGGLASGAAFERNHARNLSGCKFV